MSRKVTNLYLFVKKNKSFTATDRGTENCPRPDTKLLLSALIKAYPSENFELKKPIENENLKNNKPPAKHQRPMVYSLKSFAAIQNLVRLSL